MNGYIYGQVHKQLWRKVGLYGQTKEKHEGKQVNLFSGGSVCRYPSRRVERSLCMLCRKRRKKLNRYTDEQVHLCTCRNVDGQILTVNLNESIKSTCRVMNGYINGQVHKQLWRQVGLCGQTEEKHEGKQVNLISGGSACKYPSRRVKKSCMLCRKIKNKLHSYSDEQVHLWTCRTVETLTGRF